MKDRKGTTETLPKLLVRLSRLPDEASRRKYVLRHPQLVCPATVEQLSEAVRKQVRVDTKQALAFAEAALVIAEEIHDEEVLARALRAKANGLWFQGQCKPAVELLDRAVELFERAGSNTEVARTLSTSIQPLALLGDYDRALAAAEKARDIFRLTGEDSRLARLEINVANILHRREQWTEALTRYERAYKQLLPYGDVEGIGVALHNMAVCLIRLNDFHRALKTYQDARKFCEDNGMPRLMAQADYNIAYLHYCRGDYSRSLELLRGTRQVFKDNGDAYHRALCDLDQSEIYLELNLMKEAEQLAREASAQFTRLGLGRESMRALTNMAIAMSRTGRASAALRIFARARRKAVAENNPVWPRLIDLYRALVLLNLGDLAKAYRLATSALDFFSSYPIPEKAALCRLLLARVGLQTGDFSGAYLNCCHAIEQLGTTVDAPPILNYQTHLVMGRVREAQGDLRAAHDSYQVARIALEMLRSSLQGEELKIAFMQDRQEAYERLIHLRMTGYPDSAQDERAFIYMEEAKSRSLRDLLFGRRPLLLTPEAEASEVEHRMADLREELNWYYHRIESEQWSRETMDPIRVRRLQAEARTRENELQRILLELHSSNASDPRLKISTVFTAKQIRTALHSDAALVEYFRTADRIVAAVLTPVGLEFFCLGQWSRVAHLLRMLEFQLSRVRMHPKHAALFQKPFLQAVQVYLQQLYEEVFAPLRPSLHERHLIFVPHDVLHYLPFHALFDGNRYLIDSFTVSYAPSASIYALCHTREANVSGPCLILGVPDAKTPHILQEVESVAASVEPRQLFIGAEASLETLKTNGPTSRLIHIATHGYFRHDNPLFSGIRLGDSYLSLYDLYQLRLPVELFTLSGCATGLNVVAAGDELLGLVRGLLCVGAQSGLLTLWDVDDSSTARLMKSFYRLMQLSGNKAQALEAAMREVRDEYPHPYYWAPFMLVGKVFPS